MQRKLLEIINVDFDEKVNYDDMFCICQILDKQCEYNESVHEPFTDFKKAYDSFSG